MTMIQRYYGTRRHRNKNDVVRMPLRYLYYASTVVGIITVKSNVIGVVASTVDNVDVDASSSSSTDSVCLHTNSGAADASSCSAPGDESSSPPNSNNNNSSNEQDDVASTSSTNSNETLLKPKKEQQQPQHDSSNSKYPNRTSRSSSPHHHHQHLYSPHDTTSSTSSRTTFSDQCQLYLAPSSIPNAGIGVYTSVDFKEGDAVGEPEMLIPLTDIFFKDPWMIDDVQWDTALDERLNFESWYLNSIYYPGFGAAINCHMGLNNVHHGSPLFDAAGLHRSNQNDPGVGAFTNWYGMSNIASTSIEAGSELFVNYGENWFDTRQSILGDIPMADDFFVADELVRKITSHLDIKHTIHNDEDNTVFEDVLQLIQQTVPPRTATIIPLTRDALQDASTMGTARQSLGGQASIKSLEWLTTHGSCVDHIYVKQSTIPQAGRGAFARRMISKGDVVVPAPVLPIRRNTTFLYEPKPEDLNGDSWNPLDPHGFLLLRNYAWGHVNSSLMLLPYSPNINFINHGSSSSNEANVELRWSTNTELNPNYDEWSQWTPNDIIQNQSFGLMMEYVALRDIQPHEEILVDYGPDWEMAWKTHVQHWVPHHTNDDYMPLNDVYKNLVHGIDNGYIRTHTEQVTNPYPSNIQTACYFTHSPVTKYEEMKKDGKSSTTTKQFVTEWNKRENYDCLRYCEILRRRTTTTDADIPRGNNHRRSYNPEEEESINAYYSVKLLPLETKYSLPDSCWIPPEETIFVKQVPSYAVKLMDKRFSRDQHLLNSFRHEMRIPTHLMPSKWFDLVVDTEMKQYYDKLERKARSYRHYHSIGHTRPSATTATTTTTTSSSSNESTNKEKDVHTQQANTSSLESNNKPRRKRKYEVIRNGEEEQSSTTSRPLSQAAHYGSGGHNQPKRTFGDQCELYMGPSSIPNAGIGMYTAVDIEAGGMVGDDEIVVPLVNYVGSTWMLPDEVLWVKDSTHELLVFEGYGSTESFIPGFGAAINCHMGLNNVDHSFATQYKANLHPSKDPGTLGRTIWGGITNNALRPIKAGEELFVDYGEHWFTHRKLDFIPMYDDFEVADKLVSDFYIKYQTTILESSKNDDEDHHTVLQSVWDTIRNMSSLRVKFALPESVDDLKEAYEVGTARFGLGGYNSFRNETWFTQEALCIDHLYVNESTIPQAGLGAFLKRSLKQGDVVAPFPLLHLPRSNLLYFHEEEEEENDDNMDDTTTSQENEIRHGSNRTQLMINYCFSHDQSQVMLLPYSPVVNYINHGPNVTRIDTPKKNTVKTANVELRWSKRSFGGINQNEEWFHLTGKQLLTKGFGLLMELVALRDLDANEEILYDYGPHWEREWNTFVSEKWDPSDVALNYVDPTVMNEPQRKSKEICTEDDEIKGIHRYPPNIHVGCFYTPPEVFHHVEDGGIEAEEEIDSIVTHHEYDSRHNIHTFELTWDDELDGCIRPCRILKVEHHPTNKEQFQVVAEMLNTQFLSDHCMVPQGQRHIITNVPDYVVQFIDLPLRRDPYLATSESKTFRRHMELPPGLFPEAWLDS